MLEESTASALLGSLAEVKGALLTYTQLDIKQVEDAQKEVEQLFIGLSEDCTLRLFCANSLLQSTPENEKVSSVFYFVSRYTEPISHVLNAELHRLLSVINHVLPLGSLEIQDEGVVFRYMLLSEDRILDGLLALDIIRGLENLIPAVFEWLETLLQQSQSIGPKKTEPVKQHFRQLIEKMPILEPVQLGGLTAPKHKSSQWDEQLQLLLAVSSCFLVATLFMQFDFISSLLGSIVVACIYVITIRLWHHQYYRLQRQQKRQKQLLFSFQLLESEGIKFAYQEHALEQHRHEMIQKLANLANEPVQFPSDIVRLREQMLFLKHLQSHLIQKAHRVKLKRQELQKNRTLLLQERKVIAQHAAQPHLNSDSALAGVSSEDMLLQNLCLLYTSPSPRD